MKKWVCTVCGYVHEGNEPPEKCPQCGVPGSKFTVMEEGTALNFVCEHVIGVGAKDQVEADVYEGLKANFEGECTEVGMYIAMSRQAIQNSAMALTMMHSGRFSTARKESTAMIIYTEKFRIRHS